jgi:hypothetical protein
MKMKQLRTQGLWLLLLIFSAVLLFGHPLKSKTETFFYGIEINGKLMGYSEMEVTPDKKKGKPVTIIKNKAFIALTALGQEFDTKISEVYHMDPGTGKYTYYDSEVKVGTMEMGGNLVIDKDTAVFTPRQGGKPKILTLSPDVLLQNPLYFTRVLKDLGEAKEKQKKNYQTIDLREGELHKVTYTRKGTEKLVLGGNEYNALAFDMLDLKTGVPVKIWIDRKSGRFLRTTLPNGMDVYLADGAVVGKIKRAELDDTIFAKVDLAIADYKAISYMKIKASILSLGEWITPESLNVPGQKFTGTIKDNLIDGIFEIQHKRYNGEDAPPFPTDFKGNKELKKYLEPENLVESDDPVLVKKARELTKGSKDSWEAVRRLSKWVAEEIPYQIPGGSARHTFDTRKGECASHSRLLTAFCRAVGIPARQVSGCMYAPNYGGSFGQHVWNEIYMGKAGWITVDSTAHEIDYVDSGHIRLGTQASFNPKKMEVLDYKAGSMKKGTISASLGPFKNIPWNVGKTYTYNYIANGKSIGTETFTLKSFEKKKDSHAYVYTCSTQLNLQGLNASSEWKIDTSGTPLTYKAKGKAGTIEYSIDCRFSKDQIVEKVVKSGTPIERTIKLTDKVYLIDNNNMSLFAFLLAGVPREKGKIIKFKIFHPSSMQLLPAQVTVKDQEQITINGKMYKSWPLDIVMAGVTLKMWVDETGHLLRDSERNGAIVIDLIEDSKK